MSKLKNYIVDNLVDELKDIIDNLKDHQNLVMNKGVYCGTMTEAIPEFDDAPCEKYIAGQNNSWIVLGRDRPASRMSGYGGRGGTQSGMIDLVVGRMGGSPGGPQPKVYAAPNFFTDSARIYISQKSDIDNDFALAPGSQQELKKDTYLSAVGVKADEVRLIGRTGIKIVTGQGLGISAGSDGEKTGHGGKIEYIPSIDLIAGNSTGEDMFGIKRLQPLVKGDNLISCLRAMAQQIDDLHKLVYNLFENQSRYNNALMRHTHIATAPGGPVLPSGQAILAGIQKICEDTLGVQSTAVAHQINSAFLELMYFGKDSINYINSKHVNTT